MTTTPFVDTLPLWTICALTSLLMLACAEIGRRFERRHKVRLKRGRPVPGSPSDDASNTLATITSSTLALFALVLAFTFGSAAARYEARRTLVLRDANAIGTTYLTPDVVRVFMRPGR